MTEHKLLVPNDQIETCKSSENYSSILLEAHRMVTGVKKQMHGDIVNNLRRFVELLNVRFRDVLNRPLEPWEGAEILKLHKMVRREENPHNRENWTDDCGWTHGGWRCVEEEGNED